MVEKDFNTILNNNFKQYGFSHKIADPLVREIAGKTITSPARPHDGYAVTSYGLIFWEAKFQKGYKAFPLSNLSDNQVLSLKTIQDRLEELRVYQGYCLVILGVWIPRRHIDVFSFTINKICRDLQDSKKSMSKSELLQLCEEGHTTECKAKSFDVWALIRNRIE